MQSINQTGKDEEGTDLRSVKKRRNKILPAYNTLLLRRNLLNLDKSNSEIKDVCKKNTPVLEDEGSLNVFTTE